MTIGEKILNMRKARGWSQEELAERVGVTRQAVSRWESGSAKPDADKIIALCDLFGVSADYLLREDYTGTQMNSIASVSDNRQSTALGAALRKLTLSQWLWGIALIVCLVVMLILKIVGGFHPCYWNGIGGLEGYLRTYDLLWLWRISLWTAVCSAIALFGPPLARWVKHNGITE